ncbi:hypothetical protein [Desulfatitalea alkaliphila]|uniref:Uncharacterized protein n=1 Tax=Desulfatitalea alkaliphila TaxID=2929485 RepID=A0AA41UJC8_9BACT|nr:hypothetical protein [Desulfatitalea alkaliphila]MCJ8501014.1 hypothetical protein [Desulfatitalea alkaliphila]
MNLHKNLSLSYRGGRRRIIPHHLGPTPFNPVHPIRSKYHAQRRQRPQKKTNQNAPCDAYRPMHAGRRSMPNQQKYAIIPKDNGNSDPISNKIGAPPPVTLPTTDTPRHDDRSIDTTHHRNARIALCKAHKEKVA